MSPRSGPRPLWALDGRVAAYALIGAALYGVLGLFVARYGPAAVRPGFALVPFVGFTFGPIAGFASGFIGQGIVEGIAGVSPGASWVHGLASGLTGLLAGLAPLYVARLMAGSLGRRSLAGAVAGIVGSFVGGLVLFFTNGSSGAFNVFFDAYLPQVLANAIVSAILMPVLVYAWDPLSESMAS
jgi:energy-coupling factor transport system substrate-specific component